MDNRSRTDSVSQEEAVLPGSRSAAIGRRTSGAFIVLFLVLQIAIPLRYYLGFSASSDDERFRWRMFSSMSERRCEISLNEFVVQGGERVARKVEIARVLHARWIDLLEQNNPRTVRRFLEVRCAEGGKVAIRYEQLCTNVDGSSAPPVQQSLECSPLAAYFSP